MCAQDIERNASNQQERKDSGSKLACMNNYAENDVMLTFITASILSFVNNASI